MAGKLESLMWEMNSFISNEELKNKFQEVYNQIVEENKENVVAFIPIGYFEKDYLNISDFEEIEDYEILSGTRRTDWGDEVNSQSEYEDYLAMKADEEYEKWKVEQQGDWWYLLDNPDEPENAYSEHSIKEEAEEELAELKKDWIGHQTEWEDLEFERHEIWNTVWRLNGELDREIADRVGLGYLELSSGDEYLFLLGTGMDLSPKIIAYQALTFGCIDQRYLGYFEKSMVRYTKSVMGRHIWNEVIEKLEVAKFFEMEGSE